MQFIFKTGFLFTVKEKENEVRAGEIVPRGAEFRSLTPVESQACVVACLEFDRQRTETEQAT